MKKLNVLEMIKLSVLPIFLSFVFSIGVNNLGFSQIIEFVTITQPPLLQESILDTNISCNGSGDGSASLTASGGTTPYTYLWSTGDTVTIISALSQGSYIVTVTDFNSCSLIDSANITEPAVLTISITAVNVLCFGDSSGTAQATSTGGTSPYMYIWSGGATPASASNSNLLAATYSITVTDSNGCSLMDSITLSQPTPPALSTSITAFPESNCQQNGIALLTPSGGVIPYNYAWSHGATTQNISGLSAGTYFVTVSDSNGCARIDSAVIGGVLPPSTTLFETAETSCVSNDGTITLAVTGGATPYSYLWSNSDTSQNLIGLGGGTYSVIVTDANTCTTYDTIVVGQPPVPTVNIIGFDESSCAADDGLAAATVSGGTTPYSYSWSNSATTASILSLNADTYTLTVTDSNGCATIDSIVINQPPSVYIVDSSMTICGGDSSLIYGTYRNATGTYYDSLSTSGGCDSVHSTLLIVNSTYSISDSPMSICDGDSVLIYGTYRTIAGSYYDSLNTVVGCDSVHSTVLSANPTYSIGDPAISICNGDSSLIYGTYRTIAGTYYDSLSTVGGCDSIHSTVLLSANPTYNITDPAINICNGDSSMIYGIYRTMAGIYYDSLTTVDGCDSILTTTLTVNPNPVISLSSTDDGGGCTGGATTTVTAGTSPFSYLWDDPAAQTGSSVNGLCAGTYNVVVTDSMGCTTSDTVSVVSTGCNLTLSISTTDATCGNNDGSASATVTGGTPPYFYQWTSGDTTSNADSLMAGVYVLTVTDSGTCVQTAVAAVSNNTGPVVTVNSVTNVSCSGGLDGAIDISVNGGITPYTYAWSSGDSTADLNSLEAGPYELEVKDAGGCITSLSITVNAPSGIGLVTTSINANCGSNDGSAIAFVTGGATPYSYAWSNGATSSAVTGLGGGSYSILITDGNGCMDSAFAVINETGAAVIVVDSVIEAPCAGTGAIYISVSGGSAPYTYNWSSGDATEDVTGLAIGFYDIAVTDSVGCVAAASIEVEPEVQIIQEICLVTVDTISDVNVVVWEKPITTSISHYNIYKESTQAGVYFLAGSVLYDSLSAFTDPNSNPLQHSWRYKISTVDQCGNESGYSQVHKTMHLTINQGVGSNYNLIWDHYEGFTFLSYIIHRYHPSTGWVNLDTIQSNLFTYTDFSVPQGQTDYNVEAIHPNGCTATKTKNYNSSLSNKSTAVVPGPVTIAVTSTDASMGNCDGTATVTPNGGTLPYTYIWDDPNAQTDALATGLCAGTYNVTVIDANGNYIEGSTLINEVTGINQISAYYKVKVVPNPFHQSTTIEFTNAGQDNLHLMIYNVAGQLVREYPDIVGNTIIVNRDDLKAGTYYYHLKGQRGIDTGKLVVH